MNIFILRIVIISVLYIKGCRIAYDKFKLIQITRARFSWVWTSQFSRQLSEWASKF